MNRIVAVALLLCAGLPGLSQAQEGRPVGPNSPCSAFGTASGTCAQGGVITAGGPTGSTSAVPVITYNAAGQLTTVTTASLGTAAAQNTGTSGANVPLMNGANTWSTAQTFGAGISIGTNGGNSGAITLNGGTSGSTTIQVSSAGAPQFGGVPSSTAAVAYMCYNTSTGAVTSDISGTCLVSSLRFKHNVRDLVGSISTIEKMRPISFIYNDDSVLKGEQEGLSAESVAQADPTLVVFDKQGKPFKVKYINLIGRLVGAVQEQQREIMRQRRAIARLQKRSKALWIH